MACNQHYLNPKDASDPHRLPSIETFDVRKQDTGQSCPMWCAGDAADRWPEHDEHVGWYWQSRMPGCLPDGEPMGPFESEELALEDARYGMEDEDDDHFVRQEKPREED